jgi:alpha-tubulin suppressor-like RCC1 family protein
MATRITPAISDFTRSVLSVSAIQFISDSTILSSGTFLSNNIKSEAMSNPARIVISTNTTAVSSDIVIEPKGVGAILGSRTGIKRGINAVDLQIGVDSQSDKVASGEYSVIAGGQGNSAGGAHSLVVGGVLNMAHADGSIVVGGQGNTANGINSVVLGGDSNIVLSDYSGILGGRSNTINSTHNNSFVIGSNINTSASDTTFVNNLSAQDIIFTRRLQFSDGTFQVTAGAGAGTGYVPIQQGGGTNQTNAKIYIGWNRQSLYLQVDNNSYADDWPINIQGTSLSALSASYAQVANTVTNGFYNTGGVINGPVVLNDALYAHHGVTFDDGSTLTTGNIIKPSITLLGKNKGAKNYIVAATTNNRVVIWGKNTWFNGGTNIWPPQQAVFADHYLLDNPTVAVKKIICTNHFILILLDNGTLWHSGHNAVINIINSTQTYKPHFTQINFNGVRITDFDACSIDATNNLNMVFTVAAITEDKQLYTWGTNNSGNLGIGAQSDVANLAPQPVPQLTNVKQVIVKHVNRNAVNLGYTIALTEENRVWSAGTGAFGTLGNGGLVDTNVFVRCKTDSITFLEGKKIVCDNSTDIENIFVVDSASRLNVCGLNTDLATGTQNTDTTTIYSYFTPISSLYKVQDAQIANQNTTKTVLAVAAQSDAELEPRRLYAWGAGYFGLSASANNTPTIVPSLSSVTNIDKIIWSENLHFKQTIAVHTATNQLFVAGPQNFGLYYQPAQIDTSYPFRRTAVQDVTDASFGTGLDNEIGYLVSKDKYGNLFIEVLHGDGVISNSVTTNVYPSCPINLTNYLI